MADKEGGVNVVHSPTFEKFGNKVSLQKTHVQDFQTPLPLKMPVASNSRIKTVR